MKKVLLIAVAIITPIVWFSCKEKDPIEPTPNPHNLRGSTFSNTDATSGDIMQYLFDNTDTSYSKIQTIGQNTQTIETGKYTLEYPSIHFSGPANGSRYAGTFSNDDNVEIESKQYQRVK